MSAGTGVRGECGPAERAGGCVVDCVGWREQGSGGGRGIGGAVEMCSKVGRVWAQL